MTAAGTPVAARRGHGFQQERAVAELAGSGALAVPELSARLGLTARRGRELAARLAQLGAVVREPSGRVRLPRALARADGGRTVLGLVLGRDDEGTVVRVLGMDGRERDVPGYLVRAETEPG